MAEKLVIIGSGPAAWTCALYAARANLSPVVYEGAISEENRVRGTLPLGQLNLTTDVENYPGFPKGVPGPELMEAMREQAIRFAARVVTEDILDVDLSRRPFTVKDSAGASTQAHALVIATGASANYLGLESESRFKNFGVSACAVCDGALPRFRSKPLVVVGGGDSAAEEANHLSKFAGTVMLVHRRDKLRACSIMAQRLLSNPKVKPIWNSVVEEVLGDDERGVTGVRVKNLKTGDTSTLEAAGVFVAIGHTPNTAFLRGQVQLDPQGFIILKDPFRSATSVDGVFAAGDVADPVYKQAVTAAAMGCKAALDAERWLVEKQIH
ncbi:MAG: thioredoxin-disulfide reductase [Tepidisphaeraceae bacterium]|jgi:thioredoxin reductase (NADPH)